MIKKLLLTAVALITLGSTAAPVSAQHGERRERDSRHEDRHDRGEFGQWRPHNGQLRPGPGWHNNHGHHYKKRFYRGRYYNNGHYYHHRYR